MFISFSELQVSVVDGVDASRHHSLVNEIVVDTVLAAFAAESGVLDATETIETGY